MREAKCVWSSDGNDYYRPSLSAELAGALSFRAPDAEFERLAVLSPTRQISHWYSRVRSERPVLMLRGLMLLENVFLM